MGYDRFLRDPAELMGNPFAPLDQIATSLMQMNELDFGNSTLTCPKCGMTLREFENDSRVGCIECYNTFNDNIVREMFKQQGNTEYIGRMPAQSADTETETEEIPQIRNTTGNDSKTAKPEAAETKETEKAEPVPEKKTEKGALTLEQLMKADLGMLSDEDLEKGIKVAADAEEYKLASRLRDELKGRKDGNNND